MQTWNLEGRRIANWKTCEWQPYPGLDGDTPGLSWCPIRAEAGAGDGFYLLNVAPGSGAALHRHSAREEFIMLEGELVDGDGTVLKEGDCVSYDAGTRHRTRSPKGCLLLACIQGPIGTVDGGEELEAMCKGRRIVNWHDGGFEPYPSLPKDSDVIEWIPVRANSETGEGFYLVRFDPGGSSTLHEHTDIEEFAILEGTLTDPDGTTYVAGDCISLPPGSVHSSYSEKGCVTVAMISGPLRMNRRVNAARDCVGGVARLPGATQCSDAARSRSARDHAGTVRSRAPSYHRRLLGSPTDSLPSSR